MAIVSPTLQPATVVYPESDGKPMAETDLHRKQMTYLIVALDDWYRAEPRVYVSGNLLIYYEEENIYKSVAPDTFVVFGVPKRERRIYKIWEEGKVPDVVVEITSKSTQNEDLEGKWALYAQLGVQEYFLFDPLAEYLDPLLQGYRLLDGVYRPIVPEPMGDGDMALRSQMLEVLIRQEGNWPILYDAQTGERLLTPEEALIAWREAETRAQQAETLARRETKARHDAEAQARQTETQALQNAAALQRAEEEIQRLKAEMERLRQGRSG